MTNQSKVVAAEAKGPQASTHFPNADKAPKFEDSGAAIRNGQQATELLFEDDEEGGSTHFPNAGTAKKNEPNTRSVASARQVQAPVKRIQTGAARRLQAAVELGPDAAVGYTQPVPNDGANSTFGAGETGGVRTTASENGDADEGPQATTYFPNGEEPNFSVEADLTDLGPNSDANSSGMGGEGGLGELEDDHEVEAAPEHKAPAQHQAPTPPAAFGPDAGGNGMNSPIDQTPQFEGAAPMGGIHDFQVQPGAGIEPVGNPEVVQEDALDMEPMGEQMPLMDVDCMDDGAEHVTTASLGTVLHVIKNSRIIASMTEKMAVKAGVADVYLGEQFHTASLSEFEAQGLRAGLKAMGFTTAKVNIGGSDVLNKRVEAKAQAVTASIKRTSEASNAALGQCLAIAAVGVNNGFFKDVRNELRAALETELVNAGVTGAERLIRQVFASHGVDYAKAILTKANTLVTMPEAGRNAIAAALDMTSGMPMEQEACEEMPGAGFGAEPQMGFQGGFGDAMSPDFGVQNPGMDEFEDDFVSQEPAPETVHAALARPAHRVSASNTGQSVTAAAILNGDISLNRIFGF